MTYVVRLGQIGAKTGAKINSDKTGIRGCYDDAKSDVNHVSLLIVPKFG